MTQKTQKANKKRGEVELNIDGETLVFGSYMEELAGLMEELGTNDMYTIRDIFFPGRERFIEELERRDNQSDDTEDADNDEDSTQHETDYFCVRNTYICARHLCISHTPEQLRRLLRYEHLPAVGMSVLNCMFDSFTADDAEGTDEKKQETENQGKEKTEEK